MAAQPDLDHAASIVISCWQDLESCRRPLAMGPAGPIPYDTIEMWTRTHGLDRDWLHLLAAVIRRLDIERAERISSEMRAEEAKRRHKS